MAYQVKKSWLTIATILTGFIVYGGYVLSKVDSNITVSEFGKYILLAIPALIVTEIVGKIIFDMLNRTHEKKEQPKRMDEFDRAIEHKAVRNFSYMFLVGFFTSLLLMWVTSALFVAFIVMFMTLFISGLVLQISYIIYYNRGL